MQKQILFNQDEHTCFGVDTYSTKVSPIASDIASEFISLNPLHPNTRRNDQNVAVFRNILIEIDVNSLEKQLEFIQKSLIPKSYITFSGKKSIHCIISLEDPCKTKTEYDNLVKTVYSTLDPKNKWIDTSCKNPSRFTRQAGVTRASTGLVQSELFSGARVSQAEIHEWLLTRIPLRDMAAALLGFTPIKSLMQPRIGAGGKAELTNRSKLFLETGDSGNRGWRNEAFFLCCDAARSGYTVDEVYELLHSVDGVLEADSTRIPEDAYSKVLNDGEVGIKLIGLTAN